jgi:hypothetical protein
VYPLHRVNKVYFIYKIAFIVTSLLLLSAAPALAGLETMPPFIKLQPYKIKEQELNLWRIEDTHFKRSTPALAPDGSGMAYSEAVYEPSARQVFSRLYWVPFESMTRWDPESPSTNPDDANPELWLSFLDPNKSLQMRVMLGQTGDDTRRGFGFQTLSVVDWSADAQLLLVKRRVGLLYTGLRTSETLVFDKRTGLLSNYRELQRAVHYYWAKQLQDETLPLFQMAWSIEPLGWEIGSSNRFYFEGWAYHQNERKEYLGLWLYDIKQQRPKLISPTQQFLPLAYNAKVALLEVEELSQPYKSQWQVQGEPAKKRRWWERLSRYPQP